MTKFRYDFTLKKENFEVLKDKAGIENKSRSQILDELIEENLGLKKYFKKVI